MTIPRSTLHIVLACALGALACSSVAIWAGYHIGYGIVAGLIVGYLAYDFRSVLKAIPEAFGKYRPGLKAFRRWLYYSDPFTGPTALALGLLSAYFAWPLFQTALAKAANGSNLVMLPVLTVVSLGLVYLADIFFANVMALIADYGAYRWEGVTFYVGKEADGKLTENGWMEHGEKLKVVPTTYLSVFRWTLKGLASIASGLLWRMWPPMIKFLFGAIIDIVVEFAVALWKLFLLIHRYERILCALHGTFGGVLAYVYLISPERSGIQNALAVLFGMVLGAGLGVLDYEGLSKRVLKVVPVTAQ
jgi:hypothetical protein